MYTSAYPQGMALGLAVLKKYIRFFGVLYNLQTFCEYTYEKGCSNDLAQCY